MTKKKEPTKLPFAILIDTREQRPYEFKGQDTIHTTLRTGDYSIDGYQDRVGIERKELSDYYGCLSANRERFEKALDRMRQLQFSAIVLEASLTKLNKHLMYGNGKWSRMSPGFAMKAYIEWGWKVRIEPCEGRVQGQGMVMKLLKHAWDTLEAERKQGERCLGTVICGCSKCTKK